jgi:hypothetical protein
VGFQYLREETNPQGMTIIQKLLGKKKKKTLPTRCPITKEPIEEGYGYLLTTSQVVTSRKYWDLVMTEPETLSYTVSHFNNKASGTQMRSLIFEKYSSINNPWIVSDSCINLFEVDRSKAREQAQKWWDAAGNFLPENGGTALDTLNPGEYKTWRDYAILEAGRARMALSTGRT